ncbi:MAG TPA: hypothetical protein VNW28_02525 [Chthoniobacterales bacterium]|nr:hypothetical protein [Chthoniobacterales bacterium]
MRQISSAAFGPLDDAAEVARAGVPTVMMFVQSLRGISHNKIEDTREEHRALAVRAFDRLVSKAMEWMASRQGSARDSRAVSGDSPLTRRQRARKTESARDADCVCVEGSKVRFGESPKPARGSRALPGVRRVAFR